MKSAAQSTLLTPEEARIWIEHLCVNENRRRGAAKAAQTRKAKKKALDASSQSRSDDCCGVCKAQYCDETEETQLWIACDRCNVWYHCSCEEVVHSPVETEEYVCRRCQVSGTT